MVDCCELSATSKGCLFPPFRTMCWVWIFLLAVHLSASGVYSAKDSEEGTCRYDLTSVAAFSCLQPNGAWLPPSLTCCKALLHAIDHVPASGEGGACCLCRYMKAKDGSPGLVTTYVLCNGKDKHIVTKWSSFPIALCSVECTRRNYSSSGMGISAHEDRPVERIHDTGKDILKILWIIVAILVVMGLVCFWYFRSCKPAANASEKGRRLSLEGGPQAGRGRSSGRSSAQRKDRRF